MAKDIIELLAEIGEQTQRFLEDLQERNEIAPQIIDLRNQAQEELEIIRQIPQSKREEANSVLGPAYERSASLSQRLTGPIGPTGNEYRPTVSGMTGSTIGLLNYGQSCLASDSLPARYWGELSISRLSEYEQNSNKRVTISNEFRRVDTELADKFESGYDNGLRAREDLEQYNHAATDFRNTIETIKGRILERLRRRLGLGVKEKWNSMDAALLACSLEVPTGVDLRGKLEPFWQTMSERLKGWGGAVFTKSDVEHSWSTYIEICHAAALFFAEFDSKHPHP